MAKHFASLFNLNYRPRPQDAGDDDNDESPPNRDDGLCEDACLMIDEDSMQSVISHTEDRPGYVIAVDAASEESEQWTGKEGNEDELIQCDYDGTMKVHVEHFLTELYLRSLRNGVLTMGEIHGKPDKVWSGVEF